MSRDIRLDIVMCNDSRTSRVNTKWESSEVESFLIFRQMTWVNLVTENCDSSHYNHGSCKPFSTHQLWPFLWNDVFKLYDINADFILNKYDPRSHVLFMNELEKYIFTYNNTYPRDKIIKRNTCRALPLLLPSLESHSQLSGNVYQSLRLLRAKQPLVRMKSSCCRPALHYAYNCNFF